MICQEGCLWTNFDFLKYHQILSENFYLTFFAVFAAVLWDEAATAGNLGGRGNCPGKHQDVGRPFNRMSKVTLLLNGHNVTADLS